MAMGPKITRRRALQAGAIAMATGAGLGLPAADAAAAGRTGSPRSERCFDLDWRFFRGAAPGAEVPGFDDGAWRELDLPHDFQIEDLPDGSDDGGATTDPSAVVTWTDRTIELRAPARIGPFDKRGEGGRSVGYTVGGEGWYRKRFRLDGLTADQRVELRFEGVFHRSDVWLNGEHLGFHPYGFTGFGYDLTPHLRHEGENVLAVRVRTQGETARWYAGSGIYRHTWLKISDPVHVPHWGVAIDTPVVGEDRARVRSRVQVDNTGDEVAELQVRQRLEDPAGRTVATLLSERRSVAEKESTTYTLAHWVARPALWSPRTPRLYTAVTEVLCDGHVVDRVSETFGIRSVVMKDTGMRINGHPIEMRGLNVHLDHGPLGAVSLRASEERRIRTLLDAGFNAIRMAHHPAGPALLDVCDRLGMLVMEEFSDTWDSPKAKQDYGNYFAEWWQRDATAWIHNARNHPSVIAYSIGNEIGAPGTPFPPPVALFAERGVEIAAFVRKIDSTRPLTQGGSHGVSVLFNPEDSPANDYTDIGDVHYQNDYGDKPAFAPGKAWLQSEGYHASMYKDWKVVRDNDFVVGDFIWTGWDYIGEAGIGVPQVIPEGSEPLAGATGGPAAVLQVAGATGPYPWFGAGCGDFDLIGQEKAPLRYRRVVWGDSPLELVVERPIGHGLRQRALAWGWFDELESWTWDVPAGRTMYVRAYTTGDTIRLLLNGTEIARKVLADADQHIAEFKVGYTPGELTAVALRGGEEIGRRSLVTVGAPAALRLTTDKTTLHTGAHDLAHVLVEVVDSQGRLVPDVVTKVHFDVTGARLAGVGNGNSHNLDSFQRPRRWTYQGKALAILRSPCHAGTVTLTAAADGLKPATIELTAVRPATKRP